MRLSRVLYLLIPACTFSACAPPATEQAAAPPVVDSAAVRAAVADLWVRWSGADTAGNVAAIVEMVTDSVRVDIPGMPPILGRASWKAAAEAMYRQFKYDALNMVPEQTLAVSNELAYQRGSFHQGNTDRSGKRSMEYERYATAIRKDADGKWRLAYWMAFTDSTIAIK